MLLDILFERHAPSLQDALKVLKQHPVTSGVFKRESMDGADAMEMIKVIYNTVLKHHNIRNILNDVGIRYKYFMPPYDPTHEYNADSVVYFIKEFAKLASRHQKGKLSTQAKKSIRDYIESYSGRARLPQQVITELLATPGIRPDKPVILYRGMMFQKSYNGSYDERALAFFDSVRKGRDRMTMDMKGMSSWTYDTKTAERFARYRANSGNFDGMMSALSRSAEKRHIDGELGIIMQTIARPEDIIVDTTMIDLGSNFGGFDESEVILKPGAKVIRIFTAFNQNGVIDLKNIAEEESPAEKLIKDVISAAQAIDIQTKYDASDRSWGDSYDFNFERMPYAYENRNALIRKAQAAYDALKPVLENVDKKALDPTTVDQKDIRKLEDVKRLKVYIDDFAKNGEGSAVEYYKKNSKARRGDFLDNNRDALYTASMGLAGKETSWRDKKPVYWRLRPENQEAHLGNLIDKYIEISGKERPDTWEERLAVAKRSLGAVKGFNSMVGWYNAVTDILRDIED